MPRNIGNIPGMYYDEEKGKYFKIQASSAGPAISAYSSDEYVNLQPLETVVSDRAPSLILIPFRDILFFTKVLNSVKRRKVRAEKGNEAERVRERQRRRIKRSQILETGLAGGLWKRGLGHAGFEPGNFFARGLVRAGHLLINTDDADTWGSGMFTISHRPEVEPSTVDISFVRRDFITDARVSLKECHISSRNLQFHQKNFLRDHGYIQVGSSGNVTSMSLHESQIRATTYLSRTGESRINISTVEGASPTRRPILHEISSRRLRDEKDVSFFSSTPAPPASDLLFAYGTSAGVLATSKSLDTSWITANNPHGTSDDLFAVEFLSDNPSILLSGGRRGVLNLTDLRLPMPPIDSDTILHPSSITHIRSIDNHRIIVCGLHSSLCQYDLRFRKHVIPGYTGYTKLTLNQNPTRPALKYHAYHNTASHQAGFDIDLESGIVAAAQEADEFHPSVQLFSLQSGHKLDSPHAFGFQFRGKTDWLVKCLRFAKDTDCGMKSLYVGQRCVIQRYAWGDHDWNEGKYGGESRYAREDNT